MKQFMPNSQDDEHCLHASAWMVLSQFGIKVNMKDLEVATQYRPGNPTWPFGIMEFMGRHGLSVRSIEQFDPVAFVHDPVQAIYDQVGDDEIAARNVAISDLEYEVRMVEQCMANPRVEFEVRLPSIDDIRTGLVQGAFAICNVNSRALAGLDGYVGHFVVVDRVDDGTLQLQNPGLPPVRDQLVTSTVFEHSWKFPSNEMANVLLVEPATSRR